MFAADEITKEHLLAWYNQGREEGEFQYLVWNHNLKTNRDQLGFSTDVGLGIQLELTPMLKCLAVIDLNKDFDEQIKDLPVNQGT